MEKQKREENQHSNAVRIMRKGRREAEEKGVMSCIHYWRTVKKNKYLQRLIDTQHILSIFLKFHSRVFLLNILVCFVFGLILMNYLNIF